MQLTHLCSCRKLGYVRISTFILVTQLATFLCNYKEHKLTLLTKIKTGNFFISISISFDLTPCFQVYSFAIFHYQLAETKSWEPSFDSGWCFTIVTIWRFLGASLLRWKNSGKKIVCSGTLSTWGAFISRNFFQNWLLLRKTESSRRESTCNSIWMSVLVPSFVIWIKNALYS